MSLKNAVKVSLPEKGIVKQKVGKAVYAYYTVRSYRNKQGKPTSERVSIGRIDGESGKLIPNRNYYERYNRTEVPEIQSVKSYGLTYLTERILKELKLDRILKTIFPEGAESIIALSEYMLAEGNIMYYSIFS